VVIPAGASVEEKAYWMEHFLFFQGVRGFSQEESQSAALERLYGKRQWIKNEGLVGAIEQ